MRMNLSSVTVRQASIALSSRLPMMMLNSKSEIVNASGTLAFTVTAIFSAFAWAIFADRIASRDTLPVFRSESTFIS